MSGSLRISVEQEIDIAVLQLLDLRLVVGEADVEVSVRHHVDREFAFWCEPFDALVVSAIESRAARASAPAANSGTLNSNRCWPKRAGTRSARYCAPASASVRAPRVTAAGVVTVAVPVRGL